MLADHHAHMLDTALKARDGRDQWMNLWQELAEMFLPNRADFTNQERQQGEERSDNLWDNNPELSARGLWSALPTLLRPAGKQWFKAKPKNSRLLMVEPVRQWLYEVTQITYDALYDPRVNADKILSEVDADLVVFGTGVSTVGWHKAKRHLILKSRSLAKTCLMAGRDGQPNAAFSFEAPTLRQIVEEFGESKLTTKMKEAYDKPKPRLDQPFELVHCCVPAVDWRAMGANHNSRFTYHSTWLSVECKELIEESGYYEFPYVTPRWDTLTGEVYGRSPAMVALPDARVVHAMAKTFLEAGEMSLRPPTWSYADMIRGDLGLYPGGHTVLDMVGFQGSGDPIKAIQIGSFPEKIYEVWLKKNEQVGAAFFRDILELPSMRDKNMTATEINARLDQYLRQVAPVMARVNDSYNAALINRVFQVLLREGMFPPPPQELYGEEIEFDYESPIKTARDKAEALKIIEGLQMILPLAEASPDILDNYDFDAIARITAIKADMPQAILKPMDKVMEIRAERAKKMEMAQAAEMAAKVAPALKQVSGAGVDAMGMAQVAGQSGGVGNMMQQIAGPMPGMTSGQETEMQGDILDAAYEEVAA